MDRIPDKESLKIKKSLPQIIIPKNKNEMFLNWYNEDLRFQDDLPKIFEKGYVFIENNLFNLNISPKIISQIAKYFTYKYKETVTYRQIEKYLIEFQNEFEKITIYFQFIGKEFEMKLYGKNNYHIVDFSVDLLHTKEGENPSTHEILNMQIDEDLIKDASKKLALFCFCLIESAFWYVATTKNTIKYEREQKLPTYIYEKKTIINPKRNKVITTPIYDMSKIKIKKIEGLIKRRKGWTYSHSFQVHGHYRHYKDGKTIFINSFIKGKGKKEINQILTLNPKN